MVKSRKRRTKNKPASLSTDQDGMDISGENDVVAPLRRIVREGDFVELDSDDEYRKIREKTII
ncbi:MAG: hypothetical protein OS112_09830 [Methanoregula sp.]|nr:MAG: hypothetical protein OS112_09830 [Methanoregula sp.]